ncbi:MAG: hypothetical protein KGD68_07965 [Candidatus Lokiarchaeota archaeon]|nr:hypothetical protein [Candidatus Lokiarchaeota archaeon]
MNDEGIPIFFHNFNGSSNDDENYHVIASYFDQICRFTKYGFKESLNTLKMNESVFYFYTHPTSNYHLIFKCHSSIDKKKLKKKNLDSVAIKVLDRFLAKFNKELINFNGNYSQFKSFSSDIDEIVKSKGFLRGFDLNPRIF